MLARSVEKFDSARHMFLKNVHKLMDEHSKTFDSSAIDNVLKELQLGKGLALSWDTLDVQATSHVTPAQMAQTETVASKAEDQGEQKDFALSEKVREIRTNLEQPASLWTEKHRDSAFQAKLVDGMMQPKL